MRLLIVLMMGLWLTGCTASPEVNVLSYRLDRATRSLRVQAECSTAHLSPCGAGSLTGIVLLGRAPLPGATVVVAEPDGTPHSATTNDAGRYRLDDLPPGLYAVAATAPGAEEGQATGVFGLRRLMIVTPGAIGETPPIILQPHVPLSLPQPLAEATALKRTGDYTATSPFPPGAQADVTTWQFQRDGIVVDTLRLFYSQQASCLRRREETKADDSRHSLCSSMNSAMNPQVESGAQPPLLFIIYPSHVDGWQPVSVAFAAAGFTVAAMSPVAARKLDFDGHAQDARIALHLALNGALTKGKEAKEAIMLAGSFSSAVMHRILRDEAQSIAAVVILGGIANAFKSANDFYGGRLNIPPQHRDTIPALGFPNVRTLDFLRLSPVYAPERLPRTLIIHTAADEVIPMDQAYALEQAAKTAGVAVEAYYYQDVSHYLLIGDEMTDAGVEMFWRIIEFLQR